MAAFPIMEASPQIEVRERGSRTMSWRQQLINLGSAEIPTIDSALKAIVDGRSRQVFPDGHSSTQQKFREEFERFPQVLEEAMRLYETALNKAISGVAPQLRSLFESKQLVLGATGFTTPASGAVNYSPNINLPPLFNQFNDGVNAGMGSNFLLPEGIDVTQPVVVKIRWFPVLDVPAGDVEWQLKSAFAEVGDVLDGLLAEGTLSDITTVPLNSAEEIFESTFNVAIPVGKEAGDTLALVWHRDATPGNLDDTLASAVRIELVEVLGSFL